MGASPTQARTDEGEGILDRHGLAEACVGRGNPPTDLLEPEGLPLELGGIFVDLGERQLEDGSRVTVSLSRWSVATSLEKPPRVVVTLGPVLPPSSLA